jgi:hypothetical protein
MDFGFIFPILVTACSGVALLICAREFVFESMERFDSRKQASIEMFDKLRDRWLDDTENREITVSDASFQKAMQEIIQARASHFRLEGRQVESSSTYLVFMGGLGLLSAMGFVAGLMAF